MLLPGDYGAPRRRANRYCGFPVCETMFVPVCETMFGYYAFHQAQVAEFVTVAFQKTKAASIA